MRFLSGVTDQVLYFVAVDVTDLKTREIGLTAFTVYRSRNTTTATAMTTPTVTEVDATNMPGVYALLLDEDMTIGAGNDSEDMVFHITQAAMAPVTIAIELYREKITAGNTLDVTATGACGIDWGNIENKSTANNLSATDIQTCSSNTDMRGTDNAALASIATETRLAELDNVNLPADIDILKTRLPGIVNLYSHNAIWIDTVNGSAGTVLNTNGTENNPSNSIADATTLAIAKGTKNFIIANGSSITLAATYTNYNFIGLAKSVSWTLALGSQDISGSNFSGANISGIASGSTTAHFIDCNISTSVFLLPCNVTNSGIKASIIMGANTYSFENCYSEDIGTLPSIDFDAVSLDTTVHMLNFSGPIEIKNLGQAGTDIVTIEGSGKIVIAATCVGGVLNYRGNFEKVDNVVGGFVGTLNDNANFNITQPVGSVTNNVGGISGAVNTLDSLQTNIKGSLGASIDLTKIAQKDTGGAFVADTHSLQSIRERGDGAWITGGGGSITDILQPEVLIPPSIDLADSAPFRLGIMLTNQVDNLPSVVEITPGTISIERKPIGGTAWISIVTDSNCSESPGLIYFDEIFDSASGYIEGDSLRITFKNQKITVGANDYEISDSLGRFFYTEIRQTMIGTANAATSSALATAQLDLDDIQTRLPAALISGKMDSNISTITSNVITAASLATDAIQEIVDGVRQQVLSESYANNGVAPTHEQILYMIWSAVSEFAITGTTITSKKLDGTTTAMTHTLDSATTPTSRTRTT